MMQELHAKDRLAETLNVLVTEIANKAAYWDDLLAQNNNFKLASKTAETAMDTKIKYIVSLEAKLKDSQSSISNMTTCFNVAQIENNSFKEQISAYQNSKNNPTDTIIEIKNKELDNL